MSPGYWIDIGTVEKYLQVHLDILGGATPFPGPLPNFAPAWPWGGRSNWGKSHRPPPTVAKPHWATAYVGDFARFFRAGSAWAPTCRIGKGASLEDCVVLAGARIGDGAQLKRCVVGPDCVIGANSIVSEGRPWPAAPEVRPFSLL